MWYKNSANKYKKDSTIKFESEAEGLSRPKSIGILTVLRCISCPDLVILS